MEFLRQNALRLLLVFAPIALALELFAPERHTTIFIAAALSIVPLAGFIGEATDELAERFGPGIGGFLNATFGNAAELIIGALALRQGLFDLVKASITGSIIGNLLLVFGAAALWGGLKMETQHFNRVAASTGATMLLLSAVGLVVPAVFHQLVLRTPGAPELRLDTEIAVVLFLTYLASLVFTLRTHRHLYGNEAGTEDEAPPSARGPVLRLLAATAAVAVMSELLVGAVNEAATTLGLTHLFVGVIVVALVGNAAEHYSAVVMAGRNQMDAAIAIAVGSSIQIALFVAPVLVFLSYLIAPRPMDLLFTTFEVVSVALSVQTIAFIAHDGETHWMEGVQLLAVYIILGLAFFFLPA